MLISLRKNGNEKIIDNKILYFFNNQYIYLLKNITSNI